MAESLTQKWAKKKKFGNAPGAGTSRDKKLEESEKKAVKPAPTPKKTSKKK